MRMGMRGATAAGLGAQWGVALLVVLGLAACGSENTPMATPAPTVGPASPTVVTPATRLPATATRLPATATLAAGMFVNPLLNRDFPDPDSLRVGAMYYVYATNAADGNIPV